MTDQAPDLEPIWSEAIATIPADELTGRHRALLRLTKPVGLMNNTAVVAAPDTYTQTMIETKLRPLLGKALSQILGHSVQIAVTVDPAMREAQPVAVDSEAAGDSAPDRTTLLPPLRSEQTGGDDLETDTEFDELDELPPHDVHPEPDDDEPEIIPTLPSSPNGTHAATIGTRLTAPGRLNPKYTFENFVRGPSNRLAFAAASAVAEAPAKAYNPLFIYGGSGLGKTHLLHAIGNYAYQVFPDIKVLYVSSEEFTNDFINAIANIRGGAGDQRERFRRRYRDVDILMIDDIQFLERAEQTQEEFFHTFNTLHNANKQIVITSDRTPKELTTLEDRLRSRFVSGLTPDIQTPDLETRLAILRRKANQEGFSIAPEVLELIATRIQSNIRELEGALIRVSAFANLNDQGMDRTAAEHVLKDLIPDNSERTISATLIMQEVAQYFEVSLDELCGKSRSKALVMPRQIAMYLCRELTDLSLPRIGASFGGKDHTTVMHAYKKVAGEMKEKRHVYNQVAELTTLIKTKGRSE
ncbi:chromosomal replication initiator protein DnaA [Epidermidibacterium keratini]|uniref:Chromosomal replication initiator protein DnaA n=1 Tax=Epidermidibacterium keratini TaxID=1891644 RepID=A0A7L4YNU4_9ACTN|nr:chromosomal replication initiator protein DnaA [Epidermidibacterium keratini]QHC00479.1 chromosomal replication initiator protein DnaA [Epidermidibacterium keratini]